jgi:hypothetical protein
LGSWRNSVNETLARWRRRHFAHGEFALLRWIGKMWTGEPSPVSRPSHILPQSQ